MTDRPFDLRLLRNNPEQAALTTTSQHVHLDDYRGHRETDAKHRID
jgi:hypothetical protein